MCSHRKGNTEGPVGLDPVDIAHAARLRPREIHCLARFACHLAKELVATDPSGGAVGKPGGKQIRPSAGVKPPVMFFQYAGVNQGLAQPVNRLFWPAQPFIQLGRRRRGRTFRENLKDANGAKIWWYLFRHLPSAGISPVPFALALLARSCINSFIITKKENKSLKN